MLGFLIRDESIESPGCASHGCVIRLPRDPVWNSGDTELEVVREIALRDLQASAEA